MAVVLLTVENMNVHDQNITLRPFRVVSSGRKPTGGEPIRSMPKWESRQVPLEAESKPITIH